MQRFFPRLAALAAAFTLSAAHAAYPERPITIIVPFGAGGQSDIQTRLLEPFLSKYLGATMVVSNRPGANGIIGAKALVDSRPDGYTIGSLNFPTMVSPIYSGQAKYTLESFKPLGNLTKGAVGLVVTEDSKITDAKAAIAQIRSAPTPVNLGITGIGSVSQMAAAELRKIVNDKLTIVPYQGGASSKLAVLGKQVSFSLLNVADAVNEHRQGKLKFLAVTSAERLPTLPDVPTFSELGYNQMVFNSLEGYAVPAGTPPEIVEKLRQAFEKATRDPEFLAVARKQEMPLSIKSGDAFQAELEKANLDLGRLWATTPWDK